jgi:hypothetical protein
MQPIFIKVEFLRVWHLRGTGRWYSEGEQVELRDWIAHNLQRDGVVRFL